MEGYGRLLYEDIKGENKMRIDTEELLIELHKKGIDTEITPKQGKITVELTNTGDNTTIGVAKDETLEKALSTIIRRLVDDSKMLKEQTNILPFNGLSRL